MELEDNQYIFYFYLTYIKPYLEKQVEQVRSMKTGGPNPPHITHYTPLNKHLQVCPDVVEVAEDVRSLKQLKFYKMLIYKIVERTNVSLQESGFKGKMYLRKNFYSSFHLYWVETIAPIVAIEKEELEAAKNDAQLLERDLGKEELEEGELEEDEEEGDEEENEVFFNTQTSEDEIREVPLAQEMEL